MRRITCTKRPGLAQIRAPGEQHEKGPEHGQPGPVCARQPIKPTSIGCKLSVSRFQRGTSRASDAGGRIAANVAKLPDLLLPISEA